MIPILAVCVFLEKLVVSAKQNYIHIRTAQYVYMCSGKDVACTYMHVYIGIYMYIYMCMLSGKSV